jgi:uncharacterized protein
MEIRDPVLGPIPVLPEERDVIDHPLFQRLRRIKQLGFSQWSFPGAVHTRFLHSIGVMHLAGLAIVSILSDQAVDGERGSDRPGSESFERIRRLVRLAGLLHDVGHFPMSHSMEAVMPPRAQLALDGVANAPGASGAEPGARASHEDYTRLVLQQSSLGETLERAYLPWDIRADDVAGVLDLSLPMDPTRFTWQGRDVRRLLHQIVSSELDVDRMDYLIRDSMFSGVSYGKFDRDWLLSNLCVHESSKGLHLALHSRAVFAFDHFLLARYHMFLTVYFHYRSVALEAMLGRYFDDAEARGRPIALPTSGDALLDFDDAWLTRLLAERPGAWGRRILDGRAPKLLLEASGDGAKLRRDHLLEHLAQQSPDGLEAAPIVVESRGVLSKYYRNPSPGGLFVKRPFDGQGAIRLEDATDLFRRYMEPVAIIRVYGDVSVASEAPRGPLVLDQSS